MVDLSRKRLGRGTFLTKSSHKVNLDLSGVNLDMPGGILGVVGGILGGAEVNVDTRRT